MDQKIYKVVFVRHGESTWNLENIFTGWTDVPLSATGIREAHQAGQILKEKGYSFDICFTSYLKRAITTYNIIAEEMDLHHIPVIKTWRLNERHYGALQGLNKAQAAKEHGEDQIKIWRRSYNIPPPALEPTDSRFPGFEYKYKNIPPSFLPFSESLEDTYNRILPFWADHICEQIKLGKNVIVAAHGNSLRSIVKYLDNISEKDIPELNIPTGIPLVYELDEKLRPLKHYYLADEQDLKAKIEAVANQAKVNTQA